MDDEKWTLKNQIFDNLDEVAKLCKSPNDAYNPGGSQFKGGFFSESAIRFFKSPNLQKKYSKKLS